MRLEHAAQAPCNLARLSGVDNRALGRTGIRGIADRDEIGCVLKIEKQSKVHASGIEGREGQGRPMRPVRRPTSAVAIVTAIVRLFVWSLGKPWLPLSARDLIGIRTRILNQRDRLSSLLVNVIDRNTIRG